MQNPDTIINELRKFSGLINTSVNQFRNKQSSDNLQEQVILDFISETVIYQPWFIPEHICTAISHLAATLVNMTQFPVPSGLQKNTIGILLRTDAPLEGVAEMIYLAVSGFKLQVIVPVKMQLYFSRLINVLEINSIATGKIVLSENNFSGINAMIVFSEITSTMKNYLSKYPLMQIYRKGLSVIMTGFESEEFLSDLAFRICMFFGRSRSSIKVLFIPANYNLEPLKRKLEVYSEQLYHHNYFNNYEYRKSVMLINQIKHQIAGPLLITEEHGQAGYTGVLCIQKYLDEYEVLESSLSASFPVLGKTGGIQKELAKCFSGVAANIENIYRFILQD